MFIETPRHNNTTFSLYFLTWMRSLRIQLNSKFVNIMQIELDGIIAFKFERSQIQFFSVLLSFVWRQPLFKTFLVLQ